MSARFSAIFATLWSRFRTIWHCGPLRAFLRAFYPSIFRVKAVATCITDADERPRKYVYKVLDGAHDIRVLELLPAQNPTDPVHCKLLHVSLNLQPIQYTAISYAWGRRDAPEAVVDCDGHDAHVPCTLYSALKRLRNSKDTNQYLWTDALCIDQSGTAEGDTEKSRQVQMMHHIFATAEEVIVDLGELREGEIDIIQVLDRYQNILEEKWSAIMQSAEFVEKIHHLSQLALPAAHSAFWLEFAEFASRPWFTRIWVTQEFVLAKRVRFMMGDLFRGETFMENGIIRAFHHLSWLYAGNRAHAARDDLIPQLEQSLSDMASPANAMLHMLNLRDRRKYEDTGTFCEQLDATTALFKATDPRDKAYALLGLSSDEDIETKLIVDYKESLPDLAHRVSTYLLHQEFAVFPLYYSVGDRAGFVSWATDLENSDRDDLTQLIYAPGETLPGIFQACGKTRFWCRVSPGRPKVLQTRAYIIDELEFVMPTHLITRGELRGPTHLREQSQWLNKAYVWMLSVATTQPLAEELFIEQCWRTVIADLITWYGQGSRGRVRLRDWPYSARCIKAWRTVQRENYNKQKQSLEAIQPSVTSVSPASPTCTTLSTPQCQLSTNINEPLTLSPEIISDVRVFGESLAFSLGRKLGLTKRKRTSCLLPRQAQTGDLVVVLPGCPIPFILRRNMSDEGEYFRIVGCAYVNGIMDGEALEEAGILLTDVDIW